MKPHLLSVLLVLVALQSPALIQSADSAAAAGGEALRPYVLPECIVSGQKLEDDALTFKYQGREIRTCCDRCMDDFFQDPETYVAKINEAEQQAAAKAKEKENAKTPKKAQK